MREIKFRGIELESDNWVYGSLVSYEPYPEIQSTELRENAYDYDKWEVDPQTVGQFIGLTDQNRKEIYEGDILSYDDGSEKVQIIYNGNAFEGFRLDRKILFNNNYLQNKNYLQFNIIGNVHQNPDLLK